jgi:hypothetical protein
MPSRPAGSRAGPSFRLTRRELSFRCRATAGRRVRSARGQRTRRWWLYSGLKACGVVQASATRLSSASASCTSARSSASSSRSRASLSHVSRRARVVCRSSSGRGEDSTSASVLVADWSPRGLLSLLRQLGVGYAAWRPDALARHPWEPCWGSGLPFERRRS